MRKTPGSGIVYYNGNTYAPYSFAASTQVILQGMRIPGVTTSIGASNALYLVRIPRTHMVRAVEYGASANNARYAKALRDDADTLLG